MMQEKYMSIIFICPFCSKINENYENNDEIIGRKKTCVWKFDFNGI